VSTVEIAQRLGTAPGTVHSWRRRHADFPEPLAALAGPIWAWSDVERWAAT
jgi:transposase-like protein